MRTTNFYIPIKGKSKTICIEYSKIEHFLISILVSVAFGEMCLAEFRFDSTNERQKERSETVHNCFFLYILMAACSLQFNAM